jgi:hypothetical protein
MLIRCLALLSTLLCTGAMAGPFITRDQNPLLAGFGLPNALPPQLDGAAFLAGTRQLRLDTALNWASSAIDQRSARDALTVDAETREARFTLSYFLALVELRLQVPYHYIGGGNLDSFVDSFHDAFGLPEGARPRQPRDALLVNYQRDGVTLFDQRSSDSGLGDVSIDIGAQLPFKSDRSAAAWLSIKLPTADEDELRGSGAVDVSLSVAAQRNFGQRWEAFGQVSATWLGKGDLLPRQQRDFAASGLAGVSVRVIGNLYAKLQLDAHTAVFDGSDLEYFDEALILSGGGEYRLGDDWVFDFGISEDIAVDQSPDLVLLFGLHRRFRTRQ